MKKVIRLTESDLARIIKRVIKEQELDRELPRRTKGILGHNDYWYDENDRSVNPDEFDYDEEIVFGPDDFEDYISHTETDFPENRWSFNMKGYKGDRTGGKGYYDRYQKHGPLKLRKKRFIKEGESEEIYEKLVNKLKQSEFKSTDGENWETTVKNNMSVEVQFSGGYDIYAMVIVDGKGYARRPKGTLYDSKIVDDAIEIANMIKKGVDKNRIQQHIKQKGFTGEPS